MNAITPAAALDAEFAEWKRSQNLQLTGPPDEHLFDPALSTDQIRWLWQYCDRYTLLSSTWEKRAEMANQAIDVARDALVNAARLQEKALPQKAKAHDILD